jgi:hypothetical protein
VIRVGLEAVIVAKNELLQVLVRAGGVAAIYRYLRLTYLPENGYLPNVLSYLGFHWPLAACL